MKRFLLPTAMALLLVIGDAHPHNDATLQLLEVLRENGSISEEQYEMLRDAVEAEEELQMDAAADEVMTTAEDGIGVHSMDGRFSTELGALFQLDGALYDQDKNALGDGTEIRRGRLSLEGVVFGNWGYELDADFADGAEIKDAYVSYEGFADTSIRLGQFKEPFGLDEQTSSKNLMFMERALPNLFDPGRSIGVAVHRHGEHLTGTVGLFGEEGDDDVDDEGDEGRAITGRLTFAPVHSDTRALHFGTAASYRRVDDEEEVRFRTRPESHVTDVRYVNTGRLMDTYSVSRIGLEFAAVRDSLSLQSEYTTVELDRKSGFKDPRFYGWYVQSSWFVTGESRDYKFKKGAFGRVKPIHDYGAWELALRYSEVDANDGFVTGGRERNVTFGLNWHVNEYVKLMANYVLVRNDQFANDDDDVLGNDDPELFQLRLQLAL